MYTLPGIGMGASHILILWNHGDGGCVSGIYALPNYTTKIAVFHPDITGCDACLMTSYEMAAHLPAMPLSVPWSPRASAAKATPRYDTERPNITVSGGIAAEEFDEDTYGALYNLYRQVVDMLIGNA